MSISRLMQMGAAGASGEALAIEDVFSTYLYTGNGSTQTITNDIDLAGEGGMVWIKDRDTAINHVLQNTENGAGFYHYSDLTNAMNTTYQSGAVSSFNNNGFSVGNFNGWNQNGKRHASWTFRKAPRFFDVVTYTGTGSAPNIVSHNLGVTPGFIMVKCTSTATDWACQHIDLSNYLKLNSTQAASGGLLIDPVTDTTFKPKNNPDVNASGQTYVAYLFAHDPLGPSGDGSDGMIACGSYTGNGSTNGPEINLGWEPQWLLVKSSTFSGTTWWMTDNMRGMPVGGDTAYLRPNVSNSEGAFPLVSPTATGFKVGQFDLMVNGSGENYIYIAIRRGPMRAPESGTEVFDVNTWVGDDAASRLISTSTDVTDLVIARDRYDTNIRNIVVYDRLRGDGRSLETSSTDAEAVPSSPDYDLSFDTNGGFLVHRNSWNAFLNYNPYSALGWSFRRAPGFFDVVAYTGDGVAGRTVPHNLGVAPEMMIVKRRSGTSGWFVYVKLVGATKYLQINSGAGALVSSSYWNNTNPTESTFIIGSNAAVNGSGQTYIAYLFANLPGISKVGSYTGNGSSQTIDCGFTSGARFILIKRTDSSGDWYVWDTERGIVAGNDPHIALGLNDAEVTTDDSVDPDSSGFIVNQVAATNINVNAANYIFYAIA